MAIKKSGTTIRVIPNERLDIVDINKISSLQQEATGRLCGAIFGQWSGVIASAGITVAITPATKTRLTFKNSTLYHGDHTPGLLSGSLVHYDVSAPAQAGVTGYIEVLAAAWGSGLSIWWRRRTIDPGQEAADVSRRQWDPNIGQEIPIAIKGTVDEYVEFTSTTGALWANVPVANDPAWARLISFSSFPSGVPTGITWAHPGDYTKSAGGGTKWPLGTEGAINSNKTLIYGIEHSLLERAKSLSTLVQQCLDSTTNISKSSPSIAPLTYYHEPTQPTDGLTQPSAGIRQLIARVEALEASRPASMIICEAVIDVKWGTGDLIYWNVEPIITPIYDSGGSATLAIAEEGKGYFTVELPLNVQPTGIQLTLHDAEAGNNYTNDRLWDVHLASVSWTPDVLTLVISSRNAVIQGQGATQNPVPSDNDAFIYLTCTYAE